MARIVPLTPTVDLTQRRGQVRFRSRVRNAARHVFTLDLYSHVLPNMQTNAVALVDDALQAAVQRLSAKGIG